MNLITKERVYDFSILFKQIENLQTLSVIPLAEAIFEDIKIIRRKMNIFLENKDKREFVLSCSRGTIKKRLSMIYFGDIPNIAIEEEKMIYRLLGPLNPDLTDCCKRYGGCRMFLCDLEKFWFKGTCDYCMISISHPSFAIREPLRSGGWKGCYCSWSCVLRRCDVNLSFLSSFVKEMERVKIQRGTNPLYKSVDIVGKF